MTEVGRSYQQRLVRAKEQRNLCFYCQIRMHPDDMTWEHLVSRSHHGSNKISNLRVAHGECNVLVGNLPISIKLMLHDLAVRLGSDAFFLTVGELVRLSPGTLARVAIKRRVKRMSQRDQEKLPYEIKRIFHSVSELIQSCHVGHDGCGHSHETETRFIDA